MYNNTKSLLPTYHSGEKVCNIDNYYYIGTYM